MQCFRLRTRVLAGCAGLALAPALAACTASNGAPLPSLTSASTPSAPASSRGAPVPSTGGPPSSGVAPLPTTAAPALPRTATLHVAGGFSVIQVVAANIGPDLVRAAPPAAVAAPPLVTRTGSTVTISQPKNAQPIPVLAVKLTEHRTWRIDLNGGASVVNLDLRATHVRSVDLAAGVSSLTATLPAPTGTVPLTLGAGASHVFVRATGAPPARLTIAGGASTVTVYGRPHAGLPGGTVLESPGWPAARDRLDIRCAAGLAALTLARA